MFKSSSIYHTVTKDKYRSTKILENYVAKIPDYTSTQNQEYNTEETIFFNNTQLCFSCPICRNIVPDSCIFSLNKPKKGNLSRISRKRPSLKDRPYLIQLRSLLLNNGELDYKTQVIIERLFNLRLKYNHKKIFKSQSDNHSENSNTHCENDNDDNVSSEMNTLIIYVTLSNSWNKFIDNIAAYLFSDTPYYVLPICIRNDLDSNYMLTIFKMLIKKNINNVEVYYPQKLLL